MLEKAPTLTISSVDTAENELAKFSIKEGSQTGVAPIFGFSDGIGSDHQDTRHLLQRRGRAVARGGVGAGQRGLCAAGARRAASAASKSILFSTPKNMLESIAIARSDM